MERFGNSSYADIEKFKALSKNENTVKSTNKWINSYRSWTKDRNQPEEIEVLAPSVLDNILQQFFAEIKKQNGDNYEPNSLWYASKYRKTPMRKAIQTLYFKQ